LESFYDCLADLLIKAGRYGEAEYVMGMLKDKELLEQLRQNILCNLSIKAIAWNSVETPHIDKFDEITANLYATGKHIGALKQIKDRILDQNIELARLEVDLYQGYSLLSEFIENINDKLTLTNSTIDKDSYKLIDLSDTAPNIVAVFTVTAENNFHAVMVTPHNHNPYSSEHKAFELSKKILKLRGLLKNPGSSEVDYLPLAKELYDIIVRPMIKDLNDKGIETIIWMLNGALRLLPMSVLYDGERFMLEKFSNVCITTISNNKIAKHYPWNGLGMGVTQEHGDHQPLLAVKDELEGIICTDDSNGILPGKILLDEAFTQAAMQTNLADGYKAVHFASHFELNSVNETLSHLLLGDGSELRMDELREFPQLFKGVDLVAFSACETGLGTTSTKGREVDGIGYLGELQGAKTVLATLWKVHDSSTSMLMREFYKVRENGNSKAKALQRAQLAMLKGDLISEEGHDFTHPFFWSPFILIGKSE
jgi:CHAT domain-containing protein